MKILVFDTPADLARAVARRIADAVSENPGLVLGLAAGRTPVAAYAELARIAADRRADFSRCVTFNLDEFVGVAPSHSGSFRSFMERHLFGQVNLDPACIHFLDGTAADLDAECRRYEIAIERAGGIDLQLLGIGTNGHVAFNEPGDALVARTHRAVLAASTRADNADLFGGDPGAVPREALTMGIETILEARTIFLVGTGAAKADAVARMTSGPVTPHLPASFLRQHGRVEVFLDRKAASLLDPAFVPTDGQTGR